MLVCNATHVLAGACCVQVVPEGFLLQPLALNLNCVTSGLRYELVRAF